MASLLPPGGCLSRHAVRSEGNKWIVSPLAVFLVWHHGTKGLYSAVFKKSLKAIGRVLFGAGPVTF